jgi:MFS family permease
LGNFNGCLLSCLINDRLPRKFSIYLGNALIVIFGIISISVSNLNLFIVTRHMVSFGLGLSISCTAAIVAENINKEYRGFFLNFIIISAAIGEVIVSLSLGSLIDNTDPTQWRNLLFIAQLPVSLNFSLFFCDLSNI